MYNFRGIKTLAAIFLALLVFASCSKKNATPEKVNLGQAYYPTIIGKFVEYNVDSIVFNDLTLSVDTFRYRIKEKLTEFFTDNEGRQAIRIERYIKKFNPNKSYDSIPYTMKEVWKANVESKNVQVVEGNIRYTKLIFPVQQSASWNGNAYNTLGEQSYTYDYIDKAESFTGKSFTNVLLVKQKDDETLISKQYYIEKYAKGAGLVYREIKDIYSNTVVPGVPVEQRIENGVIYKQVLFNYGYE
ncbi:MAG: hypothetical protein JNM96_02705 [Bacteroidia bacterium]|nr:hypothetical protein [Bacteroidia bacterium]